MPWRSRCAPRTRRRRCRAPTPATACSRRSEEHTSELQSQSNLVCRLLLEKKTHLSKFSADGSPRDVPTDENSYPVTALKCPLVAWGAWCSGAIDVAPTCLPVTEFGCPFVY